MTNSRNIVLVGCAVVLGTCCFGILTIFLAFGIGLGVGQIPDTAAKPAGKIHPRQIKQLVQMGVVKPGEKVHYFYSAGMLSIREDGNLFTDQRVISYQEYEGQLSLDEATYDNILSIDFEPSGSWIDDSTITVTRTDGSWFVLYVSTESNGDKSFNEKLTELWQSRAEAEVEAKSGEKEDTGS